MDYWTDGSVAARAAGETNTRMKAVRGLFAVLLVPVFLTGCAVFQPKDPVVAVKERAQERWDALLANDLDRAYKYLSVGTRTMRSPEQYKGTVKLGLWRSAKVDSAECELDRCAVTVAVTYLYKGKVSGKVEGETHLQETWIKESGSWWYVPRQ